MLPLRSTAFVKSGTYHRPDLEHLHVVCTAPDPQGAQVLAPICKLTNSSCDPACRLERREHPFLTKPSYIMYNKALLLSQEEIVEKFKAGELTPDEDMNGQTFLRVVGGLCKSEHTPRKLKRYLGCKAKEPTA